MEKRQPGRDLITVFEDLKGYYIEIGDQVALLCSEHRTKINEFTLQRRRCSSSVKKNKKKIFPSGWKWAVKGTGVDTLGGA